MFLFTIIRWFVSIYYELKNIWDEATKDFYNPIQLQRPYKRYFLSDEHEFDSYYTRVPEDSIYVEEWIRDGEKKCYLYYEGEIIPQTEFYPNPFEYKAIIPWLWIGDKTTEVDLTHSLQKYIVPGNTIKLDLLLKLIQITDKTELMYIEPGTLKECKFPNEGITIKEDEESVSDS